MILVNHKIIIEVAAHLFCRLHVCVQIKIFSLGHIRINLWHGIFLYFRSKCHISGCRHHLTALGNVENAVHKHQSNHKYDRSERKSVYNNSYNSNKHRSQHIHKKCKDLISFKELTLKNNHYKRSYNGEIGIDHRDRIERASCIDAVLPDSKIDSGKNIYDPDRNGHISADTDDQKELFYQIFSNFQICHRVHPKEHCLYRSTQIVQCIVQNIEVSERRDSVNKPCTAVRKELNKHNINKGHHVLYISARLLKVDKATDIESTAQHHSH